MTLQLRDLTTVRKNLHFAAVFLTTVWEATRDARADAALEEIGDMRHEYDEAWKEAAARL